MAQFCAAHVASSVWSMPSFRRRTCSRLKQYRSTTLALYDSTRGTPTRLDVASYCGSHAFSRGNVWQRYTANRFHHHLMLMQQCGISIVFGAIKIVSGSSRSRSPITQWFTRLWHCGKYQVVNQQLHLMVGSLILVSGGSSSDKTVRVFLRCVTRPGEWAATSVTLSACHILRLVPRV